MKTLLPWIGLGALLGAIVRGILHRRRRHRAKRRWTVSRAWLVSFALLAVACGPAFTTADRVVLCDGGACGIASEGDADPPPPDAGTGEGAALEAGAHDGGGVAADAADGGTSPQDGASATDGGGATDGPAPTDTGTATDGPAPLCCGMPGGGTWYPCDAPPVDSCGKTPGDQCLVTVEGQTLSDTVEPCDHTDY